MYVTSEIKRPIASLKIDLANLAEAEILSKNGLSLDCVKKFEMNSFIDEEAWISLGVDQISSVKVSKEEVLDFGYEYEDVESREVERVGRSRQGDR